VKTGPYYVWYTLMSTMAILLCFVPFLFLAWKKMRRDKAYWVVGIYWLANGLINLPNLNIGLFGQPCSSPIQEKMNFIYNLLDTPLVLLLFFHATPSKRRKNRILLSLVLFTVLEIVLVFWKGYTFSTSTMIIGAGLSLTLVCTVTGLMEYMRQMEHTAFENSMVFVYAALLFAYGSFTIIYIFMHTHSGNLINVRDSFLLYYISLLLAAVITSMGLWSYGFRRRYSSSSS
jgi:hypothetical protein